MVSRQIIGHPHIDSMLGGGLVKGRITLVRGPEHAGIHHLGVSFAMKRRGIILDLAPDTTAFDHAKVAEAQRNWRPRTFDRNIHRRSDYFHIYQCLDDHGELEVGPISPEEYEERCRQVFRHRNWIAEFLYDNFSRGVNRLTIDGVHTLSTPFGDAQRSLLGKIVSEFIHVPAEELHAAAKLVGAPSEFRHADVGVVIVARTAAEFLGKHIESNKFEYDSSIPSEELPLKLEMKTSKTWVPQDWNTQICLGRFHGVSEFVLSITDHNSSSHTLSPNLYEINEATCLFDFKHWSQRRKP